MIETLAYFARISRTRVKLIATALFLFSTLIIVSRNAYKVNGKKSFPALSDSKKI
ncbi:DUF2837 family protein [Niallia sp. NCCP-28]|uniref:DUF2837 family protein n=1 Tax=Niallia sp. NCCP-28 TaxID=2934712 RepID=UPI0020BFCD36|nr:DUF2837 family protein [Niallia sp. NCCP-28]